MKTNIIITIWDKDLEKYQGLAMKKYTKPLTTLN